MYKFNKVETLEDYTITDGKIVASEEKWNGEDMRTEIRIIYSDDEGKEHSVKHTEGWHHWPEYHWQERLRRMNEVGRNVKIGYRKDFVKNKVILEYLYPREYLLFKSGVAGVKKRLGDYEMVKELLLAADPRFTHFAHCVDLKIDGLSEMLFALNPVFGEGATYVKDARFFVFGDSGFEHIVNYLKNDIGLKLEEIESEE